MRRSRLLFQLLLAGAIASPAHAAEPLPDAASFFQTPQISLVKLSPKGGYVAMAVMLPDGTQALVVRDTADPTKVKALRRVNPEETGIDRIYWINEDRLGYTLKDIVNNAQTNRDEFAVDRDGGGQKHLINGNWKFQNEQVIGTLVNSRTLRSDYAFGTVTHDGSDDIVVQKLTWNSTDIAASTSRLYRLNTRTQQISSMFEGPQPPGTREWLLDNNDTPRVVNSVVQGRCISWYRKPDDKGWTEIDNGVCYTGQRFQTLFFDGSSSLYVQTGYKEHGALFRYDLNTMTLAKEPVVETPGFDFSGSPLIDYPSKRLVGLQLQTDAGSTIWFNAALKADQAKIDAAIPGAINTVDCAAACLASPVLLVSSTSDRQPTRYLLYTRATGQVVGLGGIHDDLKPAQMGGRSFHRYAARDGRSIPVYVTMPAVKAAGPQPAVVLVHGGPGVRGSSWEWDEEAAFLSSRGYLVIQPEFRGSTGFGQAHFQAGWKQWGGTMQDDLADAAQWAVKQGWADPKRIGIMGGSYGGYATLMGLIKDPQIFRAGVEWSGVTDLGLMFTSYESDLREENLNYSMRTLIGDPNTDAAMFRKNSPALRAAELKQPLLVAHGAEDRRVPLEHASRFFSAVEEHNKQVTRITYPHEQHYWRSAANRIDFWRKVDAFLDKHLKRAE